MIAGRTNHCVYLRRFDVDADVRHDLDHLQQKARPVGRLYVQQAEGRGEAERASRHRSRPTAAEDEAARRGEGWQDAPSLRPIFLNVDVSGDVNVDLQPDDISFPGSESSEEMRKISRTTIKKTAP